MNWTEEQYAEYMAKRGIKVKKPKRSKYRNKRTNGYDSKHESEVAAELHMAEKGERITVLEQIPFTLAGGVKYVADFVILHPGGTFEVIDAKGMRTDVYKIKAKQMVDLWEIKVQEV